MDTWTKDTIFIINPGSNEGMAMQYWKKAAKKYGFLPRQPEDMTKTDIVSLIREKKPRIVAIAGGDGTINMTCRILAPLREKPMLAVLPFGFGNALACCFNVETLEKSIQALTERKYTVKIDAMKTNLPQAPLGLFNIGIGFDARIVHNRMHDRYIGFRSYVISAIKSLLFHPTKEFTIIIDHAVELHAVSSTLVIAKCPIIGKNFLVATEAKLNDGELDCTLFSSHFAYLKNLRLRGFKHPFYSKEEKIYFKAKHLLIEGEPLIQIDGDPYFHKGGIEIEILPAQFTFITNASPVGLGFYSGND